jgi:hypothetical protein
VGQLGRVEYRRVAENLLGAVAADARVEQLAAGADRARLIL